jgi:membrane AbrB-like protein
MKLKIPAGAILGSLVSVAVLQVATGYAAVPVNTKLFTQILAGLFIGKNIVRQDFVILRTIMKPAVVAVTGVITFSLAMGFLLYAFSNYDMVTSLFSSAPGGIIDMTLAADDLGADTAIVSVHQLFRFIGIVALLPAVLRKSRKGEEAVCPGQTTATLDPKKAWSQRKKIGCACLTFGIAALSGYIGRLSGIPAAAILFAMFGAAGFNMIYGRAYMPVQAKRIAQMCAGALIGSGISMTTLISLKSALATTLFIVVGFLIMNLSVGYLVHRIGNIDLITAFFACCPGGLSDVVLIANDFGADMPKLTVIQVMRCVCVLGLYPSIVHLLVTYLN